MIVELLAGISGAGLLATVGSTIYFAVKHSRAVEHAANVQVAAAHVEGELTRATFEIETLEADLDRAHKVSDALEEVIANGVSATPNSDLPRGDVHSRLVRLAQAARTDRSREVPAGAVEAVPVKADTDGADAAELPIGATTLR